MPPLLQSQVTELANGIQIAPSKFGRLERRICIPDPLCVSFADNWMALTSACGVTVPDARTSPESPLATAAAPTTATDPVGGVMSRTMSSDRDAPVISLPAPSPKRR